jgi:maltooligosyltrehalose trehalohydrolase
VEEGVCRFSVWAPLADVVEVVLMSGRERQVPLEREDRGYHCGVVEGVEPGALYMYRLDSEKLRPDPASRSQPQGVHGPSQIPDGHFEWHDQHWHGLPLADHIFYELHTGTFTPEGTFEGIIPYLDYLRDLGITAVELMPVAQFPGARNWGYDGVFPFAAQNSYGGPAGLKRLVDACHRRGLAVVLDVVYNHLGPEGNYLADFGPYFTNRHRTPWGGAVNFDGRASDEVRRYFVENALYWITDFHIDGLRLDAIHTILDFSAVPFLEELGLAVERRAARLSRRVHVIAESDLNDARVIRPRDLGGYGLHAQWSDDFHHALHAVLTGEREGYYQDFGGLRHLAKALREGFVYSGEYAPSRGRRHGNSPRMTSAHQLVVFAQNHDQIGNRMAGDRMSRLVGFEALKLAAGVVLLSPFLPLLFMGEEYGETAPFLYFVSHSDPDLVRAVREGRKSEFAAFAWAGEPHDPQDEETFRRSKLDHGLREHGVHPALLEFHKELIRLRKSQPALALLSKEHLEAIAYEKQRVLFVRRWSGDDEVFAAFHFGTERIDACLDAPSGRWRKLADSADKRWGGQGSGNPGEIVSDGEVRITMPPGAMILFARADTVPLQSGRGRS